MIRVLLVDDHVLVRQGTRALLEQGAADIEVVGETGQGEDVLPMAGRLCPDVVVLDVQLQGLNGVEVARALRRDLPDVKVLVLTAYPYEQYVRALFAIGVHGYLLKSASEAELIAGVRAVQRGETVLDRDISSRVARRKRTSSVVTTGAGTLSEREHAVLRLVSHGDTNKQIARELGISDPTVESHIGNILIKLGTRSRVEAVALAVGRGVLVLDNQPLPPDG